MSQSLVNQVVQTARNEVRSASTLTNTEKSFFDDHIQQFAMMIEHLLMNNRGAIEHQIERNLIPFVRQQIRQWLNNNREVLNQITQTIADRISTRIIAENPRLAVHSSAEQQLESNMDWGIFDQDRSTQSSKPIESSQPKEPLPVDFRSCISQIH